MLVDGSERKGGSLFEDFEPAINPPEEVDDPEDSKPSSWVDTPKCAASAEKAPEGSLDECCREQAVSCGSACEINTLSWIAKSIGGCRRPGGRKGVTTGL